MNNQPKIEAYKSFYQQGKDFYNMGDISQAREAFIKAAELANDISVNATSYDVKMDYHKAAVRIIDFLKKSCVEKKPNVTTAGNNKDEESVSEFSPLKKDKENLITFDDVAGLDDVKEQIRFKVLAPISKPEVAKRYNIRAGGKILLYGPPGTGKTFIARAISGEVDAEFFSVNCQDLISKYMGDSSKKLDELFNEAEKYERAIIFFDEFDSVASKREDVGGGVDAEMARFVATFLTKVDGFKPSQNKMLLLIAATNRPWALDSAMLRGGRFDTQIYVGVPDSEAREFLIKKAFKNIPIDDDIDISKLANVLEGYGGGDISAICERIKLEPYKRDIISGEIQKITVDDCNRILASSHNAIKSEDIEKFNLYRAGKL